MSDPNPNLALIRRAVLAIVETADVFPYKVSIGRMIAAVDQWVAVVDHKIRKMAFVVQSGWTYMQVIADTMAIVVQQELGFLVVAVVQH